MSKSVSLILALLLLAGALFLVWQERGPEEGWHAGIAFVEITPAEDMWMSGYASRDRPSEGTLSPLWAKALALEDPQGKRSLMVTMDLIGIDRDLSLKIREAIEAQHGLKRSEIVLSTSHTHTGPVVGANLLPMYALSEAQEAQVEAYAEFLHTSVLGLVDRALADLRPSHLSYGQGEAIFAVNRRNNAEAEVPALRESGQLKGPVDHGVPVLKVETEGALRAVVFGYACHATVLSSFQWSGDYPGFAQAAFEAAYPGTMAMFWAGCGADINPIPRRSEDLARDYGKRLAQAVGEALEGQAFEPIEGVLQTLYAEIPLIFDQVPTLEALEERTQNENRYIAATATHLLENEAWMQRVRRGYPYPVQTWKLGPGLTWMALGGEVVVDYAFKIREALPGTVWVAAYCNDVMAYIPSLRVLKEGGYEGGGAMVYYGLPGPWAVDVEDRIMREVKRQAAALN